MSKMSQLHDRLSKAGDLDEIDIDADAPDEPDNTCPKCGGGGGCDGHWCPSCGGTGAKRPSRERRYDPRDL